MSALLILAYAFAYVIFSLPMRTNGFFTKQLKRLDIATGPSNKTLKSSRCVFLSGAQANNTEPLLHTFIT